MHSKISFFFADKELVLTLLSKSPGSIINVQSIVWVNTLVLLMFAVAFSISGYWIFTYVCVAGQYCAFCTAGKRDRADFLGI